LVTSISDKSLNLDIKVNKLILADTSKSVIVFVPQSKIDNAVLLDTSRFVNLK